MDQVKLQVLNSDDIVYHYTSTETALQYILNNRQLRLSPRILSADPTENRIPLIKPWLTGQSYAENKLIKRETTFEFDELKRIVNEEVGEIRQVCFCMNDNDNYKEEDLKQLEYFGCMKPRMWEQYANNYNGVCLAFSLKELKENMDEKLKSISMNYVGYKELSKNRLEVNLKELKNIGYNKYEELLLSKLKKSIGDKHSDYIGENEYRIYGSSKEDYLYINFDDKSFTKALKAVIISDNNSPYYVTELKRFAKKYSAADIQIQWQSTMPKVHNIEAQYAFAQRILNNGKN